MRVAKGTVIAAVAVVIIVGVIAASLYFIHGGINGSDTRLIPVTVVSEVVE